jgi:hypothetical protein
VQDCDRRVFGVGEFVKVCCLFSLHGGCCCFWLTRPTFIQAGAEIHPTLSPAHIIMGIKETPLHELVTSPVSSPSPSRTTAMIPRTHLMFSHTTKGQPYNMELLSRFLKRMEGDRNEDVQREGMQPRLIDYELIVGEDGKRCVGFGWFAGGSFLVLTSPRFPPLSRTFVLTSEIRFVAFRGVRIYSDAKLYICCTLNSGGRTRIALSDGSRPSRTGRRQSVLGTSFCSVPILPLLYSFQINPNPITDLTFHFHSIHHVHIRTLLYRLYAQS